MKKQKHQALWCVKCTALIDSDDEHYYCNCRTQPLEMPPPKDLWKWVTVSVSSTVPKTPQGQPYLPLRKVHKNMSLLVDEDTKEN